MHEDSDELYEDVALQTHEERGVLELLLQRLKQINVDLPLNPTRQEQRIGHIKRFGQVRDSVNMLNLVNEQAVDEKVYERL
ncbi:MAG: hypothetical protein PHD43_23085 [Methylococcales bacterium]|nr:hypothetical protein [Methylococcales bacterium]